MRFKTDLLEELREQIPIHQVKLIAKRLGVTEHAVIDMNRRLGMGSFE